MGCNLGGEASATAVYRPEEHADLARASSGDLPRLAQPGELGHTPDHRRGRPERDRESPLVAGHGQLWVLVEDPSLQRTQFRTWIETERVGEYPSRPLERDQRVVLPAGGIQSTHQQRPCPLATGFLDDEAFQLGDRRRRRPAREMSLGEVLQRAQAQLVEADPGGDGEFGVGKLGVGGAAPQPEGFGQRGHSGSAGSPGELPAAIGGELLEPYGVDSEGVDGEPVAAGNGLDQLAVDPAERTAQADDVRLDGLGGRRRRILSPQRVDDRIDVHHPPRPARQQREQAAALRTGDVHLSTVRLDCQWPEHVHLDVLARGDVALLTTGEPYVVCHLPRCSRTPVAGRWHWREAPA